MAGKLFRFAMLMRASMSLACFAGPVTALHGSSRAGQTYQLSQWIGDAEDFPGVTFCDVTRAFNIPYTDGESFANIVTKIREITGVWGWQIREQEIA